MEYHKTQLHISSSIVPYPEEHEISAAIIVSEYFQSDVYFIKRNANAHTPDFKINNVIWELKSPKGDGKRTIQNNLRKADKQSSSIILDLRRCRMNSSQAISRVQYELAKANHIKRLIVITKSKEILVLK